MGEATELLAWPDPAASGGACSSTSPATSAMPKPTSGRGDDDASCFTVLEAAALEAPETFMVAVLLLVLLIDAFVSRKKDC